MSTKRMSAGAGGDSDAPRNKRSKTSQACSSCRKHKTRCELSSERKDSRCHRCRVLSLPCSFQGSDLMLDAHLGPGAPSPSDVRPSRRRSPSVDLREDLGPPRAGETFDVANFTTDGICQPAQPVGEDNSAQAWTSAPMTAMAELMRRKPSNPPVNPELYPMTGEVLTPEQIYHLVDLFETHYVAWLNIPSSPPSRSSPPKLSDFHTLARCAVTCRHLPQSTFVAVQPRLQRMAEHAVLLKTFDPAQSASLDAVYALLILSRWSPAIGPLDGEVQDGALIANGAVRMALALRLDQASERAIMIRARAQKLRQMSPEEQEVYEDMMHKARLWSAVCNVEWLLTTGTTRSPISVRSSFDHQATDWRLFPGSGTPQDARDFRLGISAQLHEATRRALALQIRDLETFCKNVNELLTVCDHARNVILPLQATFPHERAHMDCLNFSQYSSRLLMLFHALALVRVFTGASRKEKPWLLELERNGVAFVKHWGVDSIHVSQIVLVNFFDMVERYHHPHTNPTQASSPHPNAASFTPPIFSTAPDSFYTSVLYAASCLLVGRYTMFLQFNIRDSVFLYSTEALLARLVEVLDDLAVSDAHAPKRAAAVVRELRRVWHEKVVRRIAQGMPAGRELDAPPLVVLRGDEGQSLSKCTTLWDETTSGLRRDIGAGGGMGMSPDAGTPASIASTNASGIALPVSAERTNTSAPPAYVQRPSPASSWDGLYADPLLLANLAAQPLDGGFDMFSFPAWGSGGAAAQTTPGPAGGGLPDTDEFWTTFMANISSGGPG